MTTIVYRGGVLAADTGVCDRDILVSSVTKIVKSADGFLAGGAGCLGDLTAFLNWVCAGHEGDPPAFKDDDSEGLLVSPDGVVRWIGHGQKCIEVRGPYQVIGSGFKVAAGALEAGVDAAQAVRIACKLDVYSHEPVEFVKLGA